MVKILNECNNCHSNNNEMNYIFCIEICDYNYDKCFTKDRNNSFIYLSDYFNNILNIDDNLSNDEDYIVENIRNNLNNTNLDAFIENLIEKENKDFLIERDNIIYQLTSSYNQRNNQYDNISTINLGECETKLRKHYNINNNISLLLLKIDILEEGLLIPIIEYEIYNLKTEEKLNLDICKGINININIPVNIDENNIFKYNSSNEIFVIHIQHKIIQI